MEAKRFIMVQAIKTRDNELIPIWHTDVEFEKSKMYGNIIRLKGDFSTHQQVVDCIYDIKDRKLSAGVELDCYPDKNAFAISEEVYYEKDHRKLKESTIAEIVYEKYELEIMRGKKMDSYWKKYFSNVTIEPETLYAIKRWVPYFVLADGTKIEWEHQLYSKAK